MATRIRIGIVLSCGFLFGCQLVSPSEGQETAPPAGSIGDLIARSKTTYSAVSNDSVAESKKALIQDLRQLDLRLVRSAPGRRADWHAFLMWNELQQQLQGDKPDAALLQTVLSRYASGEPGVEWEPVAKARHSLRDYVHMYLLNSDEKAKDHFDAAIDELAKRNEAFSQSHQSDDAVALARAVGWLERSHHSPELVASIKKQFSRSNLQIQVSSRLVSSGIEDDVDDTTPVHENILGTQLHGTARTQGHVSLGLLPDDQRASLQILLNAKTTTQNVGYHGPVTIYSRGWTDVRASKTIHIDSAGISDEAALAKCSTSTVIDDISARLRIIEKMAWKQAGQKQAQSEVVGNQRAQRRVSARVDQQATDMLSKPRDSFETKFRAPLSRRDAFPRRLALSTTDKEILVDVLQLGPNQLAAASSPPAVSSGADLKVQLHESFAGNLTEGLFGGVTLTDEKVESMIQEQSGNVPEELKVSPDKDPWSITFSTDQPVSTQFTNDGVTISIRGRRFTRGDQEIRDPIKISATYAIEKTPTGAKMTRKGDVDIDYIAHKGNLSVKQVAFKTFMRRKFEALLKQEIVSDGLKLPGRWEQAGKLVVQQIQSGDGWLALGWDLQPHPIATTAMTDSSNRVATTE